MRTSFPKQCTMRDKVLINSVIKVNWCTMYWVRGKKGIFFSYLWHIPIYPAQIFRIFKLGYRKGSYKNLELRNIEITAFFRFKVFSPHLYQLRVGFVLCTTRQKLVNIVQLTGSHILHLLVATTSLVLSVAPLAPRRYFLLPSRKF